MLTDKTLGTNNAIKTNILNILNNVYELKRYLFFYRLWSGEQHLVA